LAVKPIPLVPQAPAPPAPTTAAAPADPHWRVGRLLSAPHRLGFFAAALLMATTAAWWAVVLFARQFDRVLPWAVPPPVAHGLVMAFGFMPLFIVGFLFTAGPRWLGLGEVPARRLLKPVLALVSGWLLALAGFHLAALVAAAGIALAAGGWAAVTLRFVALVRVSRTPDRLHAKAVAVAAGVGVLSMLSVAGAVAAGEIALARAATQLALWGFLAPTFATVSHRMIPFFTASALPALEAWRPNALLAAMLGALAATALGAVVQELGTLPAAARAGLGVLQATAALLLLWLSLRWGLVQSLRIRLLAMLHGGFVWLGLAFALAALSHARVLWLGAEATLGLAPLHALTMGYLGATLIAMITRVAAGHSGRPLAAYDLAWALYLLLQAAALLRVGAALWPAASTPSVLLAVLAWAAACVGWALRYGNWLGRPRVDGRPG
jgi:uncharacterized protein involved in response to NO